MIEDENGLSRSLARRSILSIALASFGSVICARAIDPGTHATKRDSGSRYSSTRHEWKNRDRQLLEPLKRVANTSGVLREHENAFPMTKIDKVLELHDFAGRAKPWFAVTIIGVSNQLQILDPEQAAPIHVLTVPDSHDGGIGSLVWDGQRRRIFLTSLNRIYTWSATMPERVAEYASIPDASSLYGVQLDSLGNVWVGTYPTGAVYGISAKSKKMTSTGKLAPDTDYARRLVIDEDDQIWVGTGSLNPRLFVFSSSDPNEVQEIEISKPQANGFISTLSVLGSRLVVSVSGISEQLVLNLKTRRWEEPIHRVWTDRLASTTNRVGLQTVFYTISNGELYETDTETWVEKKLGTVPSDSIMSITSEPGRVVLMQSRPEGLRLVYINAQSMKQLQTKRILLESGEFKIQSLMGHSDGNVYIGGYMGEGIASVNPDSGARWISPLGQNVINQIEGMIEYDHSNFFVGSYGYADIISVDSTRLDSQQGYARLERLEREYNQSRPFGWASNSKNVFFGTVPDYGRSGGVLGMISPSKNDIEWVLDGGGEGFIKAHSIIGLSADETHVYGTTSVRNGYGIPDTKGPAKIFKLEISSKRLVWVSAPIADTGALYAPHLIAGWLVVADIEGIIIVDPIDGSLVRKHRLSTTNNSQRRAGWASADIAIASDGKIVHSAADTTTVVDFLTGSKSTIGSRETKAKFGYRLASLPTGRVFGVLNDTSLVELDLTPRPNA
ncbi:hypothetical protein ACT3UD_16340 [Glutamicibacter sp. 287]|uniref:hypothetical protein n=1 Tax=Glutamicibacter sp. 287 TaxID=3457732 RepID=UPI004034C0C9